jgi:hypothetical protein
MRRRRSIQVSNKEDTSGTEKEQTRNMTMP